MAILAEINQTGTTICLATHDLKVAAKTDRAIYIVDGMMVSEYQLARYQHRHEDKDRERQLSEWLIEIEPKSH